MSILKTEGSFYALYQLFCKVSGQKHVSVRVRDKDGATQQMSKTTFNSLKGRQRIRQSHRQGQKAGWFTGKRRQKQVR